MAVAEGGTGTTTAQGARTNLGLAALATLNKVSSSTIENNSISSSTLITSTTGTTGQFLSLDASGQLTWNNASAAISDLTDVGTSTPTSGNILIADGDSWESVAQTDITSLGTIATGTWEADVIDIAYGGTGTTTAQGARTNLGLGLGNSPTFNGLTVTGTSNLGNVVISSDLISFNTASTTSTSSPMSFRTGGAADARLIILSNGNIGIGTSNPLNSLHINSTDGIVIPVGTNAERPTSSAAVRGLVRYNSDGSQFEGFDGSNWGSLGGVIDVDQDTYINAETSAGINNNQLSFFASGTQRMIIDSNGNVGIGTTSPSTLLTIGNNNQFTVTASGAIDATSLTLDTALAVAEGGTGTTTLTGIVVGNGNSAMSAIAAASANQLLRRNSANNAYEFFTPTYAGSGANTDITSLSGLTTALTVGQGGTGTTSLTLNGMLYGNGTGVIQNTGQGNAGNLLIPNASGVPTFVTMSGDAIINATGTLVISDNSIDGTDIALGADAQGDIMYYDGTNWTRLAAGTTGQFLETKGSGDNPTWSNTPAGVNALRDLTDVDNDVSTTSNNFLVASSTLGWVSQTPDMARVSLGLGVTDSPIFSGLEINQIASTAPLLHIVSTDAGATTTITTTTALYINSSGNIGIGTDNPTSQLHVNGGALIDNGNLDMLDNNITGVNKLTVTTIDPLYNIDGVKYSTYGPSFAGGVKEEIVGNIKLRITDELIYEYIVDFNDLEEGSDLWLFYQVIDFGKNWENFSINLTPNFNGNIWYEKDIKNNNLMIYGLPAGNYTPDSLEASYRFTANRFDWEKWPTLAPDQNEKAGLKIINKN